MLTDGQDKQFNVDRFRTDVVIRCKYMPVDKVRKRKWLVNQALAEIINDVDHIGESIKPPRPLGIFVRHNLVRTRSFVDHFLNVV